MEMKTLTVNGQTYTVADPDAAHIDDSSTAPDKTWSAQKLAAALENLDPSGVALDTTLTESGKAADAKVVGDKLKEYVKNTDYATYGKTGLMRVSTTYTGLNLGTEGAIAIEPAATANIDGRTSNRPITPGNLDYAVKVGLTANTIDLTEEEKAAACSWMGAIPAKTSDRTSVYAVNAKGEQILVGTSPNAANNGMIPIYSSDGTLRVANPSDDKHAANKGYVDGLVGDIETALDSIIEIQNGLIGGGTE